MFYMRHAMAFLHIFFSFLINKKKETVAFDNLREHRYEIHWDIFFLRLQLAALIAFTSFTIFLS